MERKKILEVKNLKVYYPVRQKSEKAFVKAVDDISFSVYEGETFGIVGESGCGKSTTGKTLVRLNKPTAGTVLFEGKDLSLNANRREVMELTQKIQIIFQQSSGDLCLRPSGDLCLFPQ